MKKEQSSGAVIFKKVKSGWSVLLIRDRNDMLTFPKGKIEKGESITDTARREAQEETGITNLQFEMELPTVTYIYTRDTQTYDKTVQYTLFFYRGNDTLHPQKEEGIKEVLWVPIEKAPTLLGYPKSNKPILETAIHHLV
jgi:8-oxo-dGTP pyrophosphatase MutT (NUDIX family)